MWLSLQRGVVPATALPIWLLPTQGTTDNRLCRGNPTMRCG